jgi:predicted ATPase
VTKAREDSKRGRNARIQVRLQNFRLFEDSGWIALDPLTCILGRNSSGKSSFVFALLLMKQSIERRVFGSVVMPLSLTGDYCDLGQFRDLARDHDKSKNIEYSFRIPISYAWSYPPEDASRPLVEIVPSEGEWSRWLGYISKDIRRIHKFGEQVELRLTFSEDEPFGPSLSRCEIDVPGVECVKFVRTISGERKQHWRTYPKNHPKLGQLVLEEGPGQFFPRPRPRKLDRQSFAGAEGRALRRFLTTVQWSFQVLEDLLGSIEMIGPFRQPPERRYAFKGLGTNKIGPSGEQAVDLLITELLIKRNSPKPLISAVSYWLRKLKLADSLKVKDAAKKLNLFEVDLRLSGVRQMNNLVDVGFGISQVLPVLVQGLLMRPGTIYIVQEPEIHLHPDAQAALADFFVYLACRGVNCIVETHSEYLLLRLRRRLAEGTGPLRTSVPRVSGQLKRLSLGDVSVLVSQHSGSEAEITRLQIGPGFQFANLPSGFMSQATEDRMLLLKAVTKRNA